MNLKVNWYHFFQHIVCYYCFDLTNISMCLC